MAVGLDNPLSYSINFSESLVQHTWRISLIVWIAEKYITFLDLPGILDYIS